MSCYGFGVSMVQKLIQPRLKHTTGASELKQRGDYPLGVQCAGSWWAASQRRSAEPPRMLALAPHTDGVVVRPGRKAFATQQGFRATHIACLPGQQIHIVGTPRLHGVVFVRKRRRGGDVVGAAVPTILCHSIHRGDRRTPRGRLAVPTL